MAASWDRSCEAVTLWQARLAYVGAEEVSVDVTFGGTLLVRISFMNWEKRDAVSWSRDARR